VYQLDNKVYEEMYMLSPDSWGNVGFREVRVL